MLAKQLDFVVSYHFNQVDGYFNLVIINISSNRQGASLKKREKKKRPWMWQKDLTAPLSPYSETAALAPSALHWRSVCRWIKYRGIKLFGSGFLSSVASALLGNGGPDNTQEMGRYTKGSRGRRHIPVMAVQSAVPQTHPLLLHLSICSSDLCEENPLIIHLGGRRRVLLMSLCHHLGQSNSAFIIIIIWIRIICEYLSYLYVESDLCDDCLQTCEIRPQKSQFHHIVSELLSGGSVM